MILIACVDDNMGMAFNHRRQSKDALLRERLLARAAGKPLWMSPYTARQFDPLPENARVDEDFLAKADEQEFAFTELAAPGLFADRVEGILLYRWNRRYPADMFFDLPLEGLRRVETSEFPGHSHEMITEEIYEK